MIYKIECKNNHPKVMKTFTYLVIAENLKQALGRFQNSDGGDTEYQEITVFITHPIDDNVFYDMPVEWHILISFTGTVEAYLSNNTKITA